MTKEIPLPKDPRHQRFADLVLKLVPAPEAYRKAGFKAKTAGSRHSGASRMLKNAEVVAYMEAVKQANAATARIDRDAMIRYCEDVMLTPLRDLDDGHPLCQVYREDPVTGERTVQMPGKLLAAKQLAELHGWNKPQEVKVEAGDKLADIIRRVRMR